MSSSAPRRPGSWSGEEQFPLVLPQDLFTSSASEDEDSSEQRNGSVGEMATPGAGHVTALHAALGVASALPWALVFPLLVGSNGRGGLDLQAVAAGCGCYFGAFAAATLALLLALPRMQGAVFWVLGAALVAKVLVSLLFGLIPVATAADWAPAVLGLLAASGAVDGAAALVASERLALPTARELTLVKTGSELNDVFRFLRGRVFDFFAVRMTEIAGSVAGALLGYLCVVALASYDLAGHFSVFRLGADTLPGFVLAVLALGAFLMFVIAARPPLRSQSPAPGRRRRLRGAEPRVQIPLLLLRGATWLLPAGSGAASSLVLLSLVGLLVAEPAISAIGQVAGWALVICFFAAGAWSVLLAKVLGSDNEVAHTPVLLASQGLQCVALAVIVARPGNYEAALAMLLVASILQCVQLEYTERAPLTVLCRALGAAVGAAVLALAVALSAPGGPALARLVAEVGIALELAMALLVALQTGFFVSRREELASYSLKSSRSHAAAGAVAELLLAECRRELAALATLGSASPLSAEDRALVARFTPRDEDPSETHLRECVSELRQLRKRLSAK